MELANRGDRFTAKALDFFICALPVMPLGLLVFFPQVDGPLLGKLTSLGFAASLSIVLWQCYMVGTTGQSFGKRRMGIRIVDSATGEHAGFARALVVRTFLNGLIGFVPLYLVVDVGFILREDRRCIHDLLAGTKVVRHPAS